MPSLDAIFYSKSLKQMNSDITSWANNLNDNIKKLRPYIELLSSVSSQLAENTNNIKQLIEEHERQLPKVLSQMTENSWYPNLDMEIHDLRTMEAHALANDFNSIEAYLVSFYRKNVEEIERNLCIKFVDRAKIITEAFKAHREARYELSVPVFLSQADGISAKFLTTEFFRSTKSIESAKHIAKTIPGTYQRLLFEPLIEAGTIRAHTSTISNKPNCFNRHAVIHGLELNYGTEINSLKCISLLSYINWMTIH